MNRLTFNVEVQVDVMLGLDRRHILEEVVKCDVVLENRLQWQDEKLLMRQFHVVHRQRQILKSKSDHKIKF